MLDFTRRAAGKSVAATGITLFLTVSGCVAPKRNWVAKDGSKTEVSLDRLYCRQQADDVAGAEYEQNIAINDSGIGGSTSLLDSLSETRARKYRRKLFESCMGSLGYTRTP